MTEHYYDHSLVRLHYYKFGRGPKKMLCFHGYGMHGRQFSLLETFLGDHYTFYGFDLFFHKETRLKDQSLKQVKTGLSKKDLASLFLDFCTSEDIIDFSLIGYSMGSYYTTALTEEIPERIREFIVIAPSCLKPGVPLRFLSRNKIGNKLLEKLALSNNGMLRLLNMLKTLRVVDAKGHEILYREIATSELRFAFYANTTYLRNLITNKEAFIRSLNTYPIRPVFIFGKRDKMYPPGIGGNVIKKIKRAEVMVLDENHELVNKNLADNLTKLLI